MIRIAGEGYSPKRLWRRPLDVRLDGRPDLNCQTGIGKGSCIKLAGSADLHSARFEHNDEAATLVPEKGSPSTFWSKGFFLKDSRGDWTPLELFLAGMRALTLQLSIGGIEAACGKQP
jgi:hypothetical protein